MQTRLLLLLILTLTGCFKLERDLYNVNEQLKAQVQELEITVAKIRCTRMVESNPNILDYIVISGHSLEREAAYDVFMVACTKMLFERKDR